MKKRVMFHVLLVLVICIAAGAGDDIETHRVHFAKGATSTSVTGAITGYDTVDYVLGASAGQIMSVAMERDNRFVFFNVLRGDSEEALFVGSAEGEPESWTGELPADGDYIVRVDMMRNEARRGKTGNFTLTLSITDPVE